MALDLFGIGSETQKQATAGYNAYKKLARKGRNEIWSGFNDAGEAYDTGEEKGLGFIDTGVAQAEPWLDKAVTEGAAPLQGMVDRADPALDYYGMLAGLQGGDAAMGALNDNPFGMIEAEGREGAIDRLERHFAGTGQPGQFALDLASGLADRRGGALNSALSALNPYFDMYRTGATGLSDLYRTGYDNRARLYGNAAGAKADITSNFANRRGADAMSRGNWLNDSFTRQGDQAVGMYDKIASGNMAGTQASWDAIINGVGGVAKAAGGYFG